jgi:hypothetical protein
VLKEEGFGPCGAGTFGPLDDPRAWWNWQTRQI